MKKIFDIEKIKKAFYTAIYLTKTKKIITSNNLHNHTILRYTHLNKNDIFVCGINHCVEILKQYKGNFNVYGIKDGSLVRPGQPILVISGDYSSVAETESVLDGILSRESSICNKVKKVLNLIKPDQLIYMGDRSDVYVTQPFDGYAAYIAGMRIFTTNAQVSLLCDKNVKVVGTMPHALIQQFNGNLSKALWAYHKTYPNEKLSALVDYHNDVVAEIKKIDKKLYPLIDSIRIDTSSSICDKSLSKNKNNFGVSSKLVLKARQALNNCGLENVKIIVSSGFNFKKIKHFIDNKIPVDKYGIGAWINKVDVNVTCDLVYLNQKKQAKFDRNLGIKTIQLKQLIKYK